jgi:hypothetical protein
MPTIHNANFEPVILNLTRVTENGDIRFTENSNTRITNDIYTSKGISGIYANALLIPFTSRLFYKLNTLWKQFFVFVKNNNIWKVPQKAYAKYNGFWKRIY